MKRLGIIVLLVLLLIQSPLTALAAVGESELALKQVAQRYKSSRILGSCILIGSGGLLAFSELEGAEDAAKLTGGVLAGVGFLTLLIKGPAEREYSQVIKVNDPIQREAMAYESLSYLADRAKRGRISSGIANGALSIYYFISDPPETYNYTDDSYYTYLGILFAGTSLYSLLSPSYEEKVFKGVKQAKERQYAVEIAPIGDSVGVHLTYNFK